MLGYLVKGLFSGLTLSSAIEYGMKKADTDVKPPVDTVSIILPSYNEEKYIEHSLSSLRTQSISSEYPDMFEYILVDSDSTDKTVELAIPYVDKVINAPRGKLNARIMASLESKGNITVAVDADTIYPFHWLNAILKPFNDPRVVGVIGSTTDYTIPNFPGQLYTISQTFARYILCPTQMVGRNSAYYKHLFYLTGMFNTTVNQQDVNVMLEEEEKKLGRNLSKYGSVVYNNSAWCNHIGGEKMACRMGLSRNCSQYKIGIERFG